MAAPMSCNTWCRLNVARKALGRHFDHVPVTKTIKHRRWFSTSPLSSKTNHEYCVDLVRKCDYENYLCCLLLPRDFRADAIAVRAYNIELAQVKDTVTDKIRGRNKFVFWRDALNKIYKGIPPKVPVAEELMIAVKQHKLTKAWLSRMLEARANQLENDQFASIEALEKYGEDTVSAMLYLTLEICGIKNVNADHAASHIGKAASLVTYLRALPYNTQQRCINLPTDLMIKNGVSQEDVFRGRKLDEISDIVYQIACQAKHHLTVGQKLKKDVPEGAYPVFLNTLICEKYLTDLEKCNFFVFDAKLQKKNGFLPMQLYMRSKKKIF